ncbi:hypothetical protein FHS89_001487 [Rubricella aquisinus]|uniref:Uncharacterized protein n=1 Tax=Rubricella aquisinus TaxID=2028108 RepID=A0A840X0Q7_9RHOB|nr:DUF6478 family protein [Rubricella aquisinus]MBB5515475.1 hypothetical protein [Rubricella aquisinus]
MASRFSFLMATLVHKLALRIWRRRHAAVLAGQRADKDARRWRRQARELRPLLAELERDVDQATTQAETLGATGRDILPRDTSFFFRPQVFEKPLARPGLARPASGTLLGEGVTLHHDVPEPDFTVRQVRNKTESPARFGLVIESYELGGTFLSLALSCPEGEAQRTSRDDLVRFTFDMSLDVPLEVFARLNLRHGPNVEQIVRELDFNAADPWVEFDIFYSQFDPKRGKDMWLDLIFQTPTMNEIHIRDVSILRRPRLSL